MTEVTITPEEWRDISRGLECHHAVFYRLWEMGKPLFTDRVPTAAVSFDRTGRLVQFLFNPDHWLKSTPYDRLFTICHECLHVVLNHGLRGRNSKWPTGTNIAMDLVVNHLLTRSFGFVRERVTGWADLCWVDTVFPPMGVPAPPADESFEFYYNALDEGVVKVLIRGGRGRTVDDHGPLAESDFDVVVDALDAELTDDEKAGLEGPVNAHFTEPDAPEEDGAPGGGDPADTRQAGTGAGGHWHFVRGPRPVKKRKWETVIKRWARRSTKEDDEVEEQWAVPNRRHAGLGGDLFLPHEADRDRPAKSRVKVRFYLDTSGSCWRLKDRFFRAALSLPTDRFDVELYCFDTVVYPTTLESKKVYGGGGTYFHILEDAVQASMAKDRAGGGPGAYPDAVFVITDGYGDKVVPAEPGRWHWFLDHRSRAWAEELKKSYIPPACHVYFLADYE